MLFPLAVLQFEAAAKSGSPFGLPPKRWLGSNAADGLMVLKFCSQKRLLLYTSLSARRTALKGVGLDLRGCTYMHAAVAVLRQHKVAYVVL